MCLDTATLGTMLREEIGRHKLRVASHRERIELFDQQLSEASRETCERLNSLIEIYNGDAPLAGLEPIDEVL